jgi:hypothetical protein
MSQYYPRQKELNEIRGYFKPRGPKSKKIEQEYGPGKADVLVCKTCKAFYWYKSWHHNLADYPELNQKKRIKFTVCPACQMIKSKKYEGEIRIYGAPAEVKKSIRDLARNYGQRAFQDDPMDRVISVGEVVLRGQGKIMRIRTTENQLAKRLAKKIGEVYRGKFELSISHSKKEDTARATLTFKEK